MTFEQIINDIRNRIFKPIYLLHGDEPYYLDKISSFIAETVLTEDEKTFNFTVLYGKDISASDIDNAARRYPMMATHQVVIIKEAQDTKKLDDLMYYAEKPSKSTVLVLNHKYKTYPKTKKLYKAIEKNGVVFESKKLYDNQVPKWINSYLAERKYKVSAVASQLLTDFLGTDLNKIANELDKLCISLEPGTEITPKHIEENIGISKDFNTFELQNALAEKDVLKANRIADYFARNSKEHPLILTITSLYFFFTKILAYHFMKDKSKNNVASELKINPFFVKDYESAAKRYNRAKTVQIISVLREYDMKSKGLGSVSETQGDLLKELIFKILH